MLISRLIGATNIRVSLKNDIASIAHKLAKEAPVVTQNIKTWAFELSAAMEWQGACRARIEELIGKSLEKVDKLRINVDASLKNVAETYQKIAPTFDDDMV